MRNIKKLRRTQGCLTDCVAYILNLHPENVPYFVYPRKGWNERLKAFLKKHGYEAHWKFCGYGTPFYKIPKGKVIICGNSLKWKTYAHVVVYKNGKLDYDPDFPSKWSNKRITHKLILKRVL